MSPRRRLARCSFAPALVIGCGWLVSCTSFAGLDDQPSPPDNPGTRVPQDAMTGGAASPAPQQPDGAGPALGATGDPLPVSQPAGMAPGDPASAGSSPDSGRGPLPSSDAGAGAAGTPGTVVPACSNGLALALDGATFASIPRVVDDDFTLEAWIKTSVSRSGTSGFYGRVLFDADIAGSAAQDDFAVTILNERLAFAVGNPDSTLQGVEVVTTDEWVHVAVTRQASTGQLQLFINDRLEAVAVAPNRAPLSARPDLGIGGFVDMRNFVGAIDEVRIWNVVRSAEQISTSLRERPSGSEEGLVGYYPFEDQGAAQTADLSPLGLDATLTGNPAYVPSSALCPPAP